MITLLFIILKEVCQVSFHSLDNRKRYGENWQQREFK